jgi:outer membrane lipopolysaccharide assembly protein LptE/RlpB
MTRYLGIFPLLILAGALLAPACGYHLGGQGDLIPKNVKTIAIPAFTNGTVRVQIAALLSADVVREFHSRTKYIIVTDPKQADVVLNGSVVRFDTLGGTTTDPVTGEATSSQIIVTVSFKLTDTHTGKVLFTKTGYEFRERYEITSNLPQYFDESSTAVKRASSDAAHEIVALILEVF